MEVILRHALVFMVQIGEVECCWPKFVWINLYHVILLQFIQLLESE